MNVTEPMPNIARLALLLPGWDRYSVWGWDKVSGHMFARLWRNIDDPDMPPAIRIGRRGSQNDGAYSRGMMDVDGLAELIARATGTSIPAVLLAMGDDAPAALEDRRQPAAAPAGRR